MTIILETERLQLRQLVLADASFILALLNTPGWLTHIGDRGVKTLAQAEAYLQNGPLCSYSELGFGLWGIMRRDNAALIGLCGLMKRPTLAAPDLGYALLPEYWGKGYAFESASATLAYAQQELGLHPILAITTQTNQASRYVLQKMGFMPKGTTRLAPDSEELLLYTTP